MKCLADTKDGEQSFPRLLCAPFLLPWVPHRALRVEIMFRNPLLRTCFSFRFFHQGQWETRVFFDLIFHSLDCSKCLFYTLKSRFFLFSVTSQIVFKLSINIKLYNPSYGYLSLYVQREGSFYI